MHVKNLGDKFTEVLKDSKFTGAATEQTALAMDIIKTPYLNFLKNKKWEFLVLTF